MNKKYWLKASYQATAKTASIAEAAFTFAGALGIERIDGELPSGGCLFTNDRIDIIAYFDDDADVDVKAAVSESLHRFFKETGFSPGEIDFSHFYEDDWQGNFVRSLKPIEVPPGIFIVPSHEYDEWSSKHHDALHIVMDPENAFGTGQHQTTQLCLTTIAHLSKEVDFKSANALDIGTGSGILAILMKKLGMSNILASETDESALNTAQKNALQNNVAIDFRLVTEEDDYGLKQYDVVVANILAHVLIGMAELIVASTKPRGHIILSGILSSQSADVIKAYEDAGVRLIREDKKDDWISLLFLVP